MCLCVFVCFAYDFLWNAVRLVFFRFVCGCVCVFERCVCEWFVLLSLCVRFLSMIVCPRPNIVFVYFCDLLCGVAAFCV